MFKPKHEETDLEPLRNDVRRLADRVDSLYEKLGDVAALEARIDGLHTNWEKERIALAELYDKAYHMLKRSQKRQRDMEKEEPEPEVPEDTLSDDPVSERVLMRRRRTGAVSPVTPG